VGAPPQKKKLINYFFEPLAPPQRKKDGPSWVHDKPPHWLHGNSIPKSVCCHVSPGLIIGGSTPHPPPPFPFLSFPSEEYLLIPMATKHVRAQAEIITKLCLSRHHAKAELNEWQNYDQFLGYFCISFWQMCRTITYHLVWPRFFFRSTCCWLPGFLSLYILYSSPISARCFVGNKTKKPQSSSSLFEINLNFTSFRSLTLLAKISPPPHPTPPYLTLPGLDLTITKCECSLLISVH